MRSMTGYGSGSARYPGGQANAEVRAVNHRFREVKVSMPRGFLAWEEEFRSLVAARVTRGRVELSVTFAGRGPRVYRVHVNHDLARAYYRAAAGLQRELGLAGGLDVAFFASRPELFQIAERPEPTREEIQAARLAIARALSGLERQRSREGRFLTRELRARIAAVDRLRRAIARQSRSGQDALRRKLQARVTRYLADVEVDQSRLLQEVAALVQKNDVTEELVRLHGHIEALRGVVRQHAPGGKRLDFLLQEVQREVNTIGAKADDVRIRHQVVEAKGEVEKLREQAQNVE